MRKGFTQFRTRLTASIMTLMNPVMAPARVATIPKCPRCTSTMVEAIRESRIRLDTTARVGAPLPPRVELPVWRCEGCGIDRPRVD